MKTESQFRSTVSLKRSKIAFSLLYRESNTPKKNSPAAGCWYQCWWYWCYLKPRTDRRALMRITNIDTTSLSSWSMFCWFLKVSDRAWFEFSRRAPRSKNEKRYSSLKIRYKMIVFAFCINFQYQLQIPTPGCPGFKANTLRRRSWCLFLKRSN